SWAAGSFHPLVGGLGLGVGDLILAVNGRPAEKGLPLERLLSGDKQDAFVITYRKKGQKAAETRAVPALYAEQELLYRDWVEANRRHVHEASKGRLGYVHIPNMGPRGYAEFFRYF